MSLTIFLILILGCQSICKEPYIEYKKGDCCLDKNEDNICDKDEGIKTQETEKAEPQVVIVQPPEKEVCPYECCVGIDFKKKFCNEGYKCKDYECELIDSDSDGLGDIEEKSLGTNPKIYDTDGDSISDFQEVKNLKTNPLKKNSDGDRYDDNEDKEPLIINSAKLKLESEEILPSIDDIIELIDNLRSVEWWMNALSNAQTKDMIILVKNEGNDYTIGFSFDVVTYVVFTKKEREGLSCVNEKFLSKEKLNVQKFQFSDKVEPSENIQKTINIDVTTTVSSTLTPEVCGGIQLCNCEKKISYTFESLEYEKYP